MVTDSGNSYAQTYHYGNYKELVLLGYVAWIYAISAISNVAGSLQSELTHGTLYKKVSSKYPLQYLFGGLYVSSVLLETITIVIVVIISKFVWGIEFSFHPAFLVPILLESLGMYGIGLIVAGIAIYFKRTGTIVFLIQTALLFVTDTVPTSDAILKITHYIPLTRCNEILRQIAVGGEYTAVSYTHLFHFLTGVPFYFSMCLPRSASLLRRSPGTTVTKTIVVTAAAATSESGSA